MNTFVIFAVLIAGAWAAPSAEEHTKSDYVPVCGEKIGVTQEAYDKFDIFGDWTDKAKCYVECELEYAGVWDDGHFTQKFKDAIESAPANADMEVGMIKECSKHVHSTGCEGAYEFAICMRDTTVGLGVAFFGAVALLVGVAVEAAGH